MNQEIKKSATAFFISLFLIAFGVSPVFAENGTGTGRGSGGGTGSKSDIALTLVSSSVKNGAVNVPLNPTVDLQFNKNVVNLTVKENNSRCFHLADGNENSVAIKIIFPDDQLRQDYREHIFVVPAQNLIPNSKYTLYIDSTLQAKNSKLINKAHTITFTTGTAVTAAVNASLKDLADDVTVYTNNYPITSQSNGKNSAVSIPSRKTAPLNNSSLSIIIIAAVAGIVILFGIILFIALLKNKKHN